MTKEQLIILCSSVSAFLVLLLLALVIIRSIHKKKIRESETAVNKVLESSTTSLAEQFGGSKNIQSIDKRGSRVTVLVHDKSLIDEKKIQESWESVLFMQNKIVFVIGTKSGQFEELLKAKASKED